MTSKEENITNIEDDKISSTEKNITKLKVEMFDIIRQQEQLIYQNNMLQEQKIRKSQELQLLENQLLEYKVPKS